MFSVIEKKIEKEMIFLSPTIYRVKIVSSEERKYGV
jgi:hypothetical protein